MARAAAALEVDSFSTPVNDTELSRSGSSLDDPELDEKSTDGDIVWTQRTAPPLKGSKKGGGGGLNTMVSYTSRD